MKHAVASLYVDEATGRMCSAGKDRVIKVWDVAMLLAPGSASAPAAASAHAPSRAGTSHPDH
jgi:hypothetical protein